jgi:hypothetical protein
MAKSSEQAIILALQALTWITANEEVLPVYYSMIKLLLDFVTVRRCLMMRPCAQDLRFRVALLKIILIFDNSLG